MTATAPRRPTSEEIRAAKKQRAFYSAKDFETSASAIGEITPTAPNVKRKASIAVADYVNRNGLDPSEIPELLMMLGIHPDQPDYQDDDMPVRMPRQFNTLDPMGK
ncbi:hypothetical protein BI081_gp112 [Mycobacterium phage Tonenili]|uniref:Uncharacterized protein n=1 Tax=Mycobacterium phage Tonenili TaxID=1891703 RepID=A0A1C9EHM5_9CAUD|nr:hypothetical protein BI081_gp112 [Mycobacterium phage Tonenili]AON96995.1 hypothetical protein SEA_TONENILI_277 [Mycobacterium phage Tonenili]